MALSVSLTLAFVAGETAAGLYSHSLSLLSDAGHNFADALSLLLSWYAMRIARRPADARRTFGYHRVGILAALANAVSLVVIALVIFWEAFERFRHPEPVAGLPMVVVALIAVVLNGLISVWLHRGAKHDLNIRSAYMHMLGDAVSALGVVVAGLVVTWTGAAIADPLVSLLIGALILWSSWEILQEAVNVLMEAAPKGLDVSAMEAGIRAVPGVVGVHHLHVWTVASGIVACSCHVVEGNGDPGVLREVINLLRRDYGIAHATVQVEREGEETEGIVCELKAGGHGHHHHEH